jgi:hypothetical protein
MIDSVWGASALFGDSTVDINGTNAASTMNRTCRAVRHRLAIRQSTLTDKCCFHREQSWYSRHCNRWRFTTEGFNWFPQILSRLKKVDQ